VKNTHFFCFEGLSQGILAAARQRACEQRWESRAGLGIYESARRMPWLLAIGQMLRVELDDVEQPVSERLAALLKELDGLPLPRA
jgi:hypothetical protein